MGKGRKILSMKAGPKLTKLLNPSVKRPIVVWHKVGKHSKQKQK